MSFINASMHFDKDGKPIEMMAWAKLCTREYKRVAEDTIEVGDRRYWVSTVWMGIDHGFGYDGPPLIFETMVFNADKIKKSVMEGGDWNELLMDRYSTKEQALAGHAEICEQVRAWIKAIDKENHDG